MSVAATFRLRYKFLYSTGNSLASGFSYQKNFLENKSSRKLQVAF